MMQTPQKRRKPVEPSSQGDGFEKVEKRLRYSSSSSTSDGETETRKPIYSATITNIPARMANQKDFSKAVRMISNLPILNTTVHPGNRATVKSLDPKLVEKLTALKNIVSETIKITSTNSRSHPPAAQPSSPATPTFSVVVKGVDTNITPEEILEALQIQKINVRNAWRIKSRATNMETRMVRVITKCPRALDTLLSNGFVMFDRRYYCEPSQSPGPQPLQCGKCFAYGHRTMDCRQIPLCVRCGEQHKATECKRNTPVCANCKGSHLPYQQSCPQRPKEVTPTKAAPVKCVDPPAEDNSEEDDDLTERFTRVEDTIRYTYLCLVNLLPQLRDRISEVIAHSAAQFFKRKVKVSFTGNKIHVSCAPIKAARPKPWVTKKTQK